MGRYLRARIRSPFRPQNTGLKDRKFKHQTLKFHPSFRYTAKAAVLENHPNGLWTVFLVTATEWLMLSRSGAIAVFIYTPQRHR